MRRAQAGMESGRVSGRSSRVLVFRIAHGGRRRGESSQKRGQAARAQATTR